MSSTKADRNRDDRRDRLVGFGLAALAAMCWATGGLAAKWLFTPLDSSTALWPIPPLGIVIDPVMLSASRAMLAFAMLFVYVVTARRGALKVRAKDLPFLGFFGIAGLALVHFTYFKTISLTSVATAILLEYLAPIIVLIVSVAVLRDRFTWSLPVSVGLSVTGCALVVGAIGGTGLVVSPAGLFWGVASAVFFAGYTLMGRWAAHRFSSWTLLTYGLGAATLFWWAVLGGPGPVFASLRDGRTLAAVTFIAFTSTVVPFGAFLKALRYIRATEASVTSTLEPVLAALVAWALFRESLTLAQMLGGLLVLAAILVSQMSSTATAELPPAN
ncbi:MAG: DMT family transporter [Actinomycetota bacterium]|nr:DMT family transporter [Actinomycetota bacterium]MDP3630782.1 DMT family transporter [Actinomycetota bacterium]